jgi:hypothetical protein
MNIKDRSAQLGKMGALWPAFKPALEESPIRLNRYFL